jgi:hypothetical protein
MTELKLVSDHAFRIFLSLATAGVGVVWTINELRLMSRLRGKDRADKRVGDQWFGYAIGILIGVIGIVGTLRFNGVL